MWVITEIWHTLESRVMTTHWSDVLVVESSSPDCGDWCGWWMLAAGTVHHPPVPGSSLMSPDERTGTGSVVLHHGHRSVIQPASTSSQSLSLSSSLLVLTMVDLSQDHIASRNNAESNITQIFTSVEHKQTTPDQQSASKSTNQWSL